jgi:hypothetical protein
MTGCSWPQTFLLGYVPASGTRHLAVRFDSKMNGTGTLRQFVSKATRPKLPGGLLLSPVCRPVSSNGGLSVRHPKTDGSHPVPQGERDPLIEQVGHSIDFQALNTARMTTCGYRDGGGRHLLNAPPWR